MRSLQTLSTAGFLALTLLAGCLCPGTLSGRDSEKALRNWDNVKSLKPGQNISVVIVNLDYYHGELVAVGDRGITIRHGAHQQTLNREDIFRISLMMPRSHTARKVLIGAAIGAGAGVGLGLVIDKAMRSPRNCVNGINGCVQYPNPNYRYTSILPAVGGPIGVAIGAELSAGAWREVYRAH